ncbi:YesL family protein [Cellulomonas endophytica]|uniref:YesL family protein n=1 Tax=Cellulomonas endophytica TaxID=2494735 RepID=UPI0010139779|nr:DUF624 domain-containing protein [Cellulomonas endophytica]
MGRLLGLHTRVGEVGLRLLALHLLWVAGTLAGGVVLGAFPAGAAVLAVVRRDVLDAAAAERPGAADPAARTSLVAEFRAAWRASFGPANRLGWTVTALWAVLLLDRRLVATVDLGGLGPALAGLLWVLTLVAAVATLAVPALAAHFDEGVRATLRRAVLLVLGRPLVALGHAAVVGVVLAAYGLVPGLVAVVGLALPALLSFTTLWRSGVLPAATAPPGPAPALDRPLLPTVALRPGRTAP